MAAYVIVDLRVTDSAGFEEYKKLVPPTIAAFGGKYVARGGRLEMLERAKEWWASEAYRLPKQMRQQSATTRMIVVESV